MISGARPAGHAQDRRARRRGLRRLLTCSAVFFALPLGAAAQEAAPLPLIRTNMGTAGLIEMPSARMGADGELSAGASFYKATQHYNLGFQILPWLEGTFRYSGLQHFDNTFPVYWDRSFGMKARLWNEYGWRPALAVGINDLVGTGLYSGEYIVLSKQFGTLDTTLGMGFGRYGSANTFHNPFAQLSRSFEERQSLTTPGSATFNFFHGPTAGVFGGVQWHTPISGLSLLAEISSDSYPFERVASSYTGGGFYGRNQMNYGISYQMGETTLGVNWLYGRALGANLSFHFDPTRPQFPVSLAPPLPAPVVRPQEEQQAALQRLLTNRNTAERPAALAHAAGKNAFVDALLQDGSVTDIRVRGATLSVARSGPASPQFCRAVVRAAQYSGTGIREILVQSGNGRPPVRCAVPRALDEPQFENAAFTTIAGLDYAALQTPLLNIDASIGSPVVDTRAAIARFKAAAKKQQIQILAVSFSDSQATVYYSNNRYYAEADAIDRLTRLLMADAPPTIEKFKLIAVRATPQQEFTILRGPAERALSLPGDDHTVFDSPVTALPARLNNPVLREGERGMFPDFFWDVYPQFRQQFFDPNNPFGVQFVAAATAGVTLAPGLSVFGSAEASLFDTFATTRLSDSELPHVRTDFLQYFTKGKHGIANLEADYQFRLTPEVYAQVRAGYLESMFAGVGGEVLWRPQGQRWSLGADLYGLQQRNFDRLFGLQSYRVVTGHVSLYYASPYYDLDFMLRAGQYLAGDRGLTLQVTRRFSTGVEIGAFVTKTNVSAAQFGEGSFDKGIVIRIPLGWVAPISTQSQINMDLRPVQRDGGQTLAGDATLYWQTLRASEGEIFRSGKALAGE